MLEIYVDADGCPVKEEVYRVARRYGLRVWVVANDWLRVPEEPLITRVVVAEGLDCADDWIAERIGPGDVAVTADVPLADRCIKRGARAIAPNGRIKGDHGRSWCMALRRPLDPRRRGRTRGRGRSGRPPDDR